MTEFQVYLWLMLDNFKFFWVLPLIISVAFFIIGASLLEDESETGLKIWKKICAPCFWIVFACVCLSLVIPSSKQYAVIKILPKLANSAVAQEIPQDTKEMYQMAKDYLKDMMKPKEAK